LWLSSDIICIYIYTWLYIWLYNYIWWYNYI
jgi:hypothetical protein